MDKLFNWVSVAAGIFGGCFVWMFGGWDKLFGALVTLIILDYITGVLKAVYNKKLSSEIGFKGLVKKLLIFIMAATANVLQAVTGDSVALREIVIMFFIANEGISLLENCAEVSGTRVPMKLREVLLQLRGQDESGEINE